MNNKCEICLAMFHSSTLYIMVKDCDHGDVKLSKHIQKPSHENLEIIYVWVKLSNAM
jgi:hypothetical protein